MLNLNFFYQSKKKTTFILKIAYHKTIEIGLKRQIRIYIIYLVTQQKNDVERSNR